MGFGAVAGVLVAGEDLATRTTRTTLTTLRSMQIEHEPLARSASAVLAQLVAFDRAIGEYVQSRDAGDFSSVTAAGDALETALTNYFALAPGTSTTPGAPDLRAQLTRHIATARELASRVTQRAQWASERQAALNRVYQRVAGAGGTGLAINGTQVVANRSLAELQAAINAVRGSVDSRHHPRAARTGFSGSPRCPCRRLRGLARTLLARAGARGLPRRGPPAS